MAHLILLFKPLGATITFLILSCGRCPLGLWAMSTPPHPALSPKEERVF
ncbi:MAG: hypothetical protein G3M78_03280 [Candidatus Nitrohelix vancouverensis]|uniref:Uncharacterized protein n=1 Tax=Candidatus Nitrohelix vancouverensis TaxID=2705534 RepID=A0A7T0G2L5_9BACT|nr:MAG: hypothetical protein G3M78_03280 [Candidatus Nitrohelix vancouverensis]